MSPQHPPSALRVASVPAAHPYVAHLGLTGAGIDLLPDPQPPGAPPGRWWPPEMLTANWISAHADRFDLLHIHFGVESLTIDALSRALEALAQARRPLVFTVHDLENPQLSDQSHHLAQLELLIPRATELITLTRGAADEIERRWGRTPAVIPHPRMLGPETPAEQLGARSETGGRTPLDVAEGAPLTIGVHLRDLRPGIDGPGVVTGLAGAIELLAEDGISARGRVVVFPSVRDRAAGEQLTAITAAATHLTLVEQPRVSEVALAEELSRLDVSLLPYRHGTHSGWAELCWDLGLPIVGAPVGYVAEQHDEPGWFSATDPCDPAALAQALSGPAGGGPAERYPRPGPERTSIIVARREIRRRSEPELRQGHRAVYHRALGSPGAP